MISENEFLNCIRKITGSNLDYNIEMKLNNYEEFDSLDLMSISAWVSDTYDLELPVSELQNMENLKELFEAIANKSL